MKHLNVQKIFNVPVITVAIFLTQLGMYGYLQHRPYTLTPQGRTYTILGKNFFYPNMILQSKEGAWGIQDTHTTRTSPRIFAQLYFVFLGKLAALLSIHQVHMYILAQVFGAGVVFLTTGWFIQKILPNKYHVPAFLFATLLEAGPLLSTFSTTLSLWQQSFPTQSVIERHFGLPHHSSGIAVGLFFLGMFFISIKKVNVRRLIILFLSGVVATTILPSFVLTIIISAFPGYLLYQLITKQLSKRSILVMCVFISSFLLAALFMKHEFGKGLPWTAWTAAEKSWWDNADIFWRYVSSMFFYYPFFILFFISLPFVWKKWTNTMRQYVLFLVCWLTFPAVFVWLGKEPWFPLANGRLTDSYHYQAAGILAAVGLVSFFQALPLKKIRMLIIILCSVPVFAVSLLFSTHIFSQTKKAQENFDWHVYVPSKTWEGVLYVKHLPKGSGVLVREYYGEILPAFGNIRVFIGGAHGFPDFLERRWLGDQFFTGEMTARNAQEFLQTNDISYVFYGPDEKALTKTSTFYPQILTPIYQNTDVILFSVNRK